MLYTCIKLHDNIFKSFNMIEQTRVSYAKLQRGVIPKIKYVSRILAHVPCILSETAFIYTVFCENIFNSLKVKRADMVSVQSAHCLIVLHIYTRFG